MPLLSQKRPMLQARACVRSPAARSVRVHVNSPVDGPESAPKEEQRKGMKNFFTDAIRSVVQTERAKGLSWKSSEFSGKIEHDEHQRRMTDSSVSNSNEKPPSSRPQLSLPAPAEMTVTLRRYVVEMLEKVANSIDGEVAEPKWKVNEFEGKVRHRHNGDHHGR